MRDFIKRWSVRLAAPAVPLTLAIAAFAAPALGVINGNNVWDCGVFPGHDSFYEPCGPSPTYVESPPDGNGDGIPDYYIQFLQVRGTHATSDYYVEWQPYNTYGTALPVAGPYHFTGTAWKSVAPPTGNDVRYAIPFILNVSPNNDHFYTGIAW